MDLLGLNVIVGDRHPAKPLRGRMARVVAIDEGADKGSLNLVVDFGEKIKAKERPFGVVTHNAWYYRAHKKLFRDIPQVRDLDKLEEHYFFLTEYMLTPMLTNED